MKLLNSYNGERLTTFWAEFLQSFELKFLIDEYYEEEYIQLLKSLKLKNIKDFGESTSFEFKLEESMYSIATWNEERWFESSHLHYVNENPNKEQARKTSELLEYLLTDVRGQRVFYEFLFYGIKEHYSLSVYS